MNDETPVPPGKQLIDRRFERFQLKVPVYIAVDGGTYRKTLPLESRDVSAGGLSFETSRKIPLNAKWRVVVSKLGDVSAPVQIYGRVAYSVKDPASGRYKIGLEFLEFVNITREDLLARIEAWSRRGEEPPTLV